MRRLVAALLLVPLLLIFISSASAGEADVLRVKASQSGGKWSFAVTVEHADEGWDHYANQWEVLTTDGGVQGTRILAHPHVGEQPFTRSLSGVEVPAGTTEVIVRARDSVHGYGGVEVKVLLEEQD